MSAISSDRPAPVAWGGPRCRTAGCHAAWSCCSRRGWRGGLHYLLRPALPVPAGDIVGRHRLAVGLLNATAGALAVCAAAYLYLMNSEYITGTVVTVDGGATLP